MRKKIRVEQAEIGMFVCELCGAWIDHSFWRSAFLIRSARDLAELRSSNVREVWIDSSKGKDVPEGIPTQNAYQVRQTIDRQMSRIDAEHALTATPLPSTESRERAYQQAAQVYRESTQAVCSMFQEVRMGNTIDAAHAQQVVETISDAVMEHPDALVSLTRIKYVDDYTYMHSVAVCALMMSLARQLNLSAQEINDVGLAGLLHDLGKVDIPIAVLNKPGRLTETEFALIQTHSERGYERLLHNPSVSDIVLDVCRHHHEKNDGTGYPDQLSGSEISLYAKIGSVCDIYDAVTSNRPYKQAWNPSEALRKMAELTPEQLDVNVFHAFVKNIGIYPVGSLVKLSPCEHLGVVVGQNQHTLLKPKVRVFYSARDRVFVTPYTIDLNEAGCLHTISGRETPEYWGIHPNRVNEMWTGG